MSNDSKDVYECPSSTFKHNFVGNPYCDTGKINNTIEFLHKNCQNARGKEYHL